MGVRKVDMDSVLEDIAFLLQNTPEMCVTSSQSWGLV